MTDDLELRDKDYIVLQTIEEGRGDVQKITAETTLENHHISYCFEKLEDLGLITVEKPDKMVERVIDGQKRVFQHPKQAEITEKGHQYLEESEQEDLEAFKNMSHRELVEKVRQLETEVDDLRHSIEMYKTQIMQKLE